MPIRSSVAILMLLVALAQAQTEPVNPKVLERYKQMLGGNPVEGVAMERLWKAAVDAGSTDTLISEYQQRADFSGRMVLGHLLRRSGRIDDAARAYGEAAKLEGKNPLPAIAIAKLEMDRARPAAAVPWLERASNALPSGDPKLLETVEMLGAALIASGNREKAAEAWERAIALDPANLETRRRLANAYADNYLTDSAIRHFEFLAERSSPADRAAALQRIAHLHSSAGHPGKALEALERALSFTAPGNWLRPELIGQIVRLAQRQNAEDALEAKWKAQAEANPRDIGAALQMVEFYSRLGKLEQETAWLEKISAQLPKASEYRLRLAKAYAQWDRLDRAVAEYDRLIAEQPGNTDLVFERARLDVQREDFESARRRLRAMLSQKPGDESLRAKALQFFHEYRLHDLVEETLKADAAAGAEEPVVALANFYFSQRRREEAQATLSRLIQPSTPAEKQAALRFRTAQILRSNGELLPAIESLQAAIRLQPNHREFHLFHGELEMLLRRYVECREAFIRAYTLSKTNEERIEADSKTFETFRAEVASEDSQGESSRPARATMAARVEGFIRDLMREANELKTADSWLRVARWKAWNSDRASAVTFAVKAADLAPEDQAPREFLARLAITHGDAAMALLYLRELTKLNAANRESYLREMAQMEMQRNETRAAIELWVEILRTNPGSADALSGLANAQERSGELKAARVTWEKAVAVSPAAQKREASTALLRVLQQLGNHQEAAEWLLRAVDATGDEQERGFRFDELLLHARQHSLLPWLRNEFQERRKQRADDYFTAMSLGRILKLSGDKSGAFELFADAIYSAPNQADALPELIREAEDLRRLDVAVRLQEQLTRVAPQANPDDLLKLAALHFKLGDLEGAERAWIRAVARFPRDVEVARRAADFHQQWGEVERAAGLLRKIAALEPSDARAALEWGEAEYQSGRFAEARLAFESVLKLTRPVTHRFYPAAKAGSPWGERGLFAGTARASRAISEPVMLASPWRSMPQNTGLALNPEAELRLRSIVRLATIAKREGGLAQAKWIADWQPLLGSQTTDALWALYFGGGESAALKEVLAASRVEAEVEGPRQAFIWMSIESGGWEGLRDWANADGRSESDLRFLGQAFASWISAYPESISSALLDALFPNGKAAQIWPCALELAKQRRFAAAITLGRRAWQNLSTQRAYIGRELATWHLALSQRADVEVILREVASMPADSLESPSMLALRELYYLLPADQRLPMLKQRAALAQGDVPSAIMARLVCHILSGDDEAARNALRELVAQRPLGAPGIDDTNSVSRSWAFLSSAHRQLIAWGRPDLAREVWRSVFEDPGMLAWQREQKTREPVEGGEGLSSIIWVQKRSIAAEERRIREQIEVVEYLLGGAVERGVIRDAAAARGSASLEKLGDSLSSLGAVGESIAAFLRAWERDGGNGGLLRKTLDAAKMSGDADSSEAIRRRCLEMKSNPGSESSPREFVLELADLLSRRGALEEALEIVHRARTTDADFRLAAKEGELLSWLGREADSKRVLATTAHGAGGSAQGRSALALMLENKGDLEGALAARSRGGMGGDPQVPILLCKLGRMDDAVQVLERLPSIQAVYAAMVMAEILGLRGEGKVARSVLLGVAGRAVDPRSQMQLRSKLITIPGMAPSSALVTRMQASMRGIAQQHPELSASYFDFFQSYAARFGMAEAWRKEVEETWADGRGAISAGLSFARMQVAEGSSDAARTTLEKIASRAEVDEAELSRADAIAASAKLEAIRPAVARLSAAQQWPAAEPLFVYLRRLDAAGRREAAREELSRMDWLCAYPGGAQMIAREWLAFGDPERARQYFGIALQQNPLVDDPILFAGMARVQIAAKRLPAARLLLRRAYASTTCREHEALIEYLAAASDLPRWKEVTREFGLSAANEYEFALALFAYFERSGRAADALALVAINPRLVVPPGMAGDEAPATAVTCERLRAMARRSGAFAETALVLDQLKSKGMAGAEAARAALEADRAAAVSEPVLPHLIKAWSLATGSWEHTKPLVEAQLATGERPAAKKTLERFLERAVIPVERSAALEIWEKANRGN